MASSRRSRQRRRGRGEHVERGRVPAVTTARKPGRRERHGRAAAVRECEGHNSSADSRAEGGGVGCAAGRHSARSGRAQRGGHGRASRCVHAAARDAGAGVRRGRSRTAADDLGDSSTRVRGTLRSPVATARRARARHRGAPRAPRSGAPRDRRLRAGSSVAGAPAGSGRWSSPSRTSDRGCRPSATSSGMPRRFWAARSIARPTLASRMCRREPGWRVLMNERSSLRASVIISCPTFSSRVMRPTRSATRSSTVRAGFR